MSLRNFDIFEKFPDGSMTWRTCVCGKFEAERKLHELTEHSNNEFLRLKFSPVNDWLSEGNQNRRKLLRKPRTDHYRESVLGATETTVLLVPVRNYNLSD